MDPENFKDIIFNEDLSQINDKDLDALISEYPYFDFPRLIELLKIKQNKPDSYTETLSHTAIYFSDKKRLYQLLNSDLRNTLIKEYKPENKTLNIHSESEEKQELEQEDKDLLDFSYSQADSKKNEKSKEKDLEESEIQVSQEKNNGSLIDKFLIEEPGPIRADKKTSLTGDVSKASVVESENLLTDTLAKIYVKQGLYNKAIFAYEKLSLKYPEKSVYFASQIKEIKELINKK